MPLRRRSTASDAGSDPVAAADEQPARPGAKGRPTPKRRDAQKKRRTAVAPTNRKEAAALRRQRLREQRQTQREALVSGDERYLPPRDAGPAKRLARDIVDARFTVGQVFFGLILLVLLLSFINSVTIRLVTNVLSLLVFAAVIVDGIRIGRIAKRRVTERHGEKSAVGITAYAAMRALQPRRLRRPPAKVRRGDTF